MSDTPPSDLVTRLEQLEARVEVLAVQLENLDWQVVDWDRLNMERLKLNERTADEALEGVRYLLMKVFPSLPRAMRDIRKIIGEGDDDPNHPLDRR